MTSGPDGVSNHRADAHGFLGREGEFAVVRSYSVLIDFTRQSARHATMTPTCPRRSRYAPKLSTNEPVKTPRPMAAFLYDSADFRREIDAASSAARSRKTFPTSPARRSSSPATADGARFSMKAAGVLAGLASRRRRSRLIDPSSVVRGEGARTAIAVEAGDVVAEVSGERDRAAGGRADGAQPHAARLGHRHDDAALRRRRARARRRRSTTRARPRRGCARSTSTRSAAAAGENHRIGLYDMFLDQEQPRRSRRLDHRGGRADPRRRRCRRRSWSRCATCAELDEALALRPDFILLDNMTPDEMRAAVERVARRGPARGVGRHHARQRPRDRRDRRRPDLHRRADAFGDGARHLDAHRRSLSGSRWARSERHPRARRPSRWHRVCG